MKEIKPTNQNSKILGEAIAGKIAAELNKKKTGAQDFLNSIDTRIKFR